MLNELRSAVLLLLFCAAAGLLFRFLLPEGGVARTARILVSLLMLCAVCTPLFGVMEYLGASVGEGAVFGTFGEPDTTFPRDLYREAAEEAVRTACDGIVGKYTDVPRKITVDAHITEDNGIWIERVRIVFGAPPEGRERIEQAIAEECGVIPEIRVELENDGMDN